MISLQKYVIEINCMIASGDGAWIDLTGFESYPIPDEWSVKQTYR
jgi:hypothetical protein